MTEALGTTNVFGTPVFTRVWTGSEQLNAEIAAAVLARRDQGENAPQYSNVGGWHSKSHDLLRWEAPGIPELVQRFQSAATEMTSLAFGGEPLGQDVGFLLNAWANVLEDGGYNSIHDHAGSHWSFVYYVDVGKVSEDAPPHSGQLELHDPRGAINMVRLQGSNLERRLIIDPVPGLLIGFPSWLKHSVHPFRGDGPRISIACNARVKITP